MHFAGGAFLVAYRKCTLMLAELIFEFINSTWHLFRATAYHFGRYMYIGPFTQFRIKFQTRPLSLIWLTVYSNPELGRSQATFV